MNQSELNREVSRKTGEPVSTIAGRGFILLAEPTCEREPETIDWERVESERNISFISRRQRTPAVM